MWTEEELTWRLISLNHCTLKEKQKDTLRVVVYCRTLMICADLFSRFSYEMSKSQYYPPSAPERSEIVSLACFMLVLLNTAKM